MARHVPPACGPSQVRLAYSGGVNICVFCSAADLDDRYTRPAREFAGLIGKGGHTLVWGGSDSGLMKVMADGVQEAGGRLVGVSVEFLAHKARPGADEMVITRDLAERKAQLLARADGFVIMVGGSGTLDEATEILELRKHGLHTKPVVLLNTAGFYDGLKQQFQRMEAEGFLPLPLTELVFFAEEGVGAIAYLEEQSGLVPPVVQG
ncbi:cytokinin riboside 5'-monophosphate phosphoribohydrolase [Nonomuraea spiralis]|nr:cytokinin riboside 5'-monophosphate phosphoribohydrolase [Nonomuraea spiralis]